MIHGAIRALTGPGILSIPVDGKDVAIHGLGEAIGFQNIVQGLVVVSDVFGIKELVELVVRVAVAPRPWSKEVPRRHLEILMRPNSPLTVLKYTNSP